MSCHSIMLLQQTHAWALSLAKYVRIFSCAPFLAFSCVTYGVTGNAAGEQRRSVRFQEAACLRPDCDHPGGVEDTNEYFVERIIGRRPYRAERDTDVTQPTKFMWLVKWDGYVFLSSAPPSLTCFIIYIPPVVALLTPRIWDLHV